MLICVVSLDAPHHGACAADEEPDDEVVRDGQQPGLDQGQAAGEVLGVGDVEPGRVVGDVGEGERRVAVGAQGVVAVVGDPPGPAEHAEVEPEDPRRVAAGDEDGEPGDDGQDREGDPEEDQHDQVWHQQQPFDQPQPAGQPWFQPAFDADGVGRSGGDLSMRVVVGHEGLLRSRRAVVGRAVVRRSDSGDVAVGGRGGRGGHSRGDGAGPEALEGQPQTQRELPQRPSGGSRSPSRRRSAR